MDGLTLQELRENEVVRKRLAKVIARNCFRNSKKLENMHAAGKIDQEAPLRIEVNAAFEARLCAAIGWRSSPQPVPQYQIFTQWREAARCENRRTSEARAIPL